MMRAMIGSRRGAECINDLSRCASASLPWSQKRDEQASAPWVSETTTKRPHVGHGEQVRIVASPKASSRTPLRSGPNCFLIPGLQKTTLSGGGERHDWKCLPVRLHAAWPGCPGVDPPDKIARYRRSPIDTRPAL